MGVRWQRGGDAVPSQVCSNEGKCICRSEWTGKDCSVYDPIPEPKPTGETERYKGPCPPRGPRVPAAPRPRGLGCPTLSPANPESPLVPSPNPGATARLGTAGSGPSPQVPTVLGLPCGRVPMSPATDVCPCPLLPVPSVTGPSGTNIIIGSIAGAVLVAAIVLGGTGWGFK